MHIFSELTDNGLHSCTWLVGQIHEDGGSFWRGLCATRCAQRLAGPVQEISLKAVGHICFKTCVSVYLAFLYYTRYRFLAIYIESNILVHDGLPL